MLNATHWDYRVTRKMVSANTSFYAIREVYYDVDETPVLWSTNPVSVGGESVKDIRADLDLITEALSKPVLDVN